MPTDSSLESILFGVLTSCGLEGWTRCLRRFVGALERPPEHLTGSENSIDSVSSYAAIRGFKIVTRKVPEGLWDPTKIPRIQNSLSEVGSLLNADDAAYPQLEG